MENHEKNKTIVIVLVALAALCGCIVVSCIATICFTLSHVDEDTITEVLNSEEMQSFEEEAAAEEPVITVESNETETEAEETASAVSEEEAAPIVLEEETAPEVSEEAAAPDVSDDGNTEDTATEASAPAAADASALSQAEQTIIDATEKTRGLKAESPMAPLYKSEEELRSYLMDQLAEISDEEMKDELDLYRILAFAPDDFDLRQFYVDMYAEQISGYYDTKTNEMFLIDGQSDYDNALTLAHEYTHYLQYNHPEFKDTLHTDDDYCTEHGEECLVIDALVEGDASLVESLTDSSALLSDYSSDSQQGDSSGSVFDEAPKYFQDSLYFPYEYGFNFVWYLYMKGGFDAVNRAYTQLPESVEQIMHPEKYLKDSPIEVTTEPFRSVIAENCDIVTESVFNEDDILMLLGSSYDKDWRISERQAAAGSEGWGGGSYIFGRVEDKLLFFTKTVWDSENDAEEAESAFKAYTQQRFGRAAEDGQWKAADGSSVTLIRQGDILYWMILPDNFDAAPLTDLILNGSAM